MSCFTSLHRAAAARDPFVLRCLVEDDDCVLTLEVPPTTEISALKRLVWEERKFGLFREVDKASLVIRKLVKFEMVDPDNTLPQRLAERGSTETISEVLSTKKTLQDIFQEPPPRDVLHMIVQYQSAARVLGKRKRVLVDISSEIIRFWLNLKVPLPRVGELKAYLGTPFEEEEKVPISDTELQRLVSIEDMLTKDDLRLLFKESEDEEADAIWMHLKPALRRGSPNTAGTENSFIPFWNDNITAILSVLIRPATTIRDSNLNTSTKLQRPGFGLLIDNVCTFRGIEKQPGQHRGDPKSELCEKLTWTYDPAPFILGYHAIGAVVTLAAIVPHPTQVINIVTSDLASRRERLFFAMRMIRLCPLLKVLKGIIGNREVAEFLPIVRSETCTTITIGRYQIHKKYETSDHSYRLEHLKNIYHQLSNKGVPNVDRLAHSAAGKDGQSSVAYLEPKGINRVPKDAKDVLSAVTSILSALRVLHAQPNPIFHRDIRWPNVIQDAAEPLKWFLIDWDDAASPPTRAAMHLNPATHSPSAFENGHGAEVDIWGVGRLLVDAGTFALGISAELMEIGQKMVDGVTATAEQALQDLEPFLEPVS